MRLKQRGSDGQWWRGGRRRREKRGARLLDVLLDLALLLRGARAVVNLDVVDLGPRRRSEVV